MYRITQQIDFCYGHRLLNYSGKCRHLHGHNARVLVVLEGDALDERGMLVDFSEVKNALRTWIDETLVLVAHDGDPVAPVIHTQEHRDRHFVWVHVALEGSAGALGIGSPDQRQLTVEMTGRAGELDLVGSGPAMRMSHMGDRLFVGKTTEGDQRVLQRERAARPLVWLTV